MLPILLGCTATQSGGLGPPGNPEVAIVVSPTAATLNMGVATDFSARAQFKDGSTGSVAVTWTATGGTISATGHYVAGSTPGLYKVKATDPATNLQDSAAITIPTPPPPPPFVGVEISPSSASLATGGSIDFTVLGRRGDGSTGPIAVTWTATGGTISTAGHFVAGTSAGNFKVIATQQGGLLADTAAVTLTASPPPIVSIEVTPASATLTNGGTADFTAIGHLSGGGTTGVAVTWSATGGTISAAGHYVAGNTAGSFRAIATLQGGVLADTAAITITVSPPPIISITVTPAATTLAPGGAADFTAIGNLSGGGTAPVTVTWSATGGTVSSAGHYVAGNTAGAFQVTASQVGGVLTGSAAVTISSAPPPVVLLQEDFETTNFAAKGWYDNTTLTTSTVEHISGSTRSLEVLFNAGATKPTFGVSARHAIPASETVYLSYWVKYSANWVGSGVNYHPHEFQFVTNEDPAFVGPSVTHLTTYVEHNYQNGGIPVLEAQDGKNIDTNNINVDLSNITEARSTSGCNGNTDGYVTDCYQGGGIWQNEKLFKPAGNQVYFTPAPGPGYKNDWHHIEAYFQLNSIANGKGQLDGVVRYWFDGQLIIDHSNVLLRTGVHTTMKFNQFLIAPYIGVGSPVTQTMWVDDLLIATAKP